MKNKDIKPNLIPKPEKPKLVIIIFAITILIGTLIGKAAIDGAKNNNTQAPTETTQVNWGKVPGQERTEAENIVVEKLQSDAKVVVTYIDVGQGESILCQLPDQTNLLIDSGPLSGIESVLAKLSDKGISKINHLILSSPNEEHIGATEQLLGAVEVENVYMPNIANEEIQPEAYKKAVRAVASAGKTLFEPEQGSVIYEQGDALVAVLTSKHDYREAENHSIGIRLKCKDVVYLFMSDLREPAEQALADAGVDTSASVLKIGDHGSNAGTYPDFIEKVKPQVAVVMPGPNGDISTDVHNRITVRGAQLYQTSISGSITISSDGTNVTVSKER